MAYSRLLSRALPCVLATSAVLAACSRADFDPDPDAGGDPPDAGGFVSDGSPDDGPASDGGYYFIGTQAPHADLFRSIDWSTPTVATKIAASTARTPNNSRFTIAYAVKPSRNPTE